MDWMASQNWFVQVQRAMDVLSVQHRVLADNIANANTPAFTRLQIDFAEELSRLTSETQSGADSPAIEAKPDTGRPARPDGNNVNLEQEMAALSQTNEMYSVLAKIAAKQLRITRYVISGGR